MRRGDPVLPRVRRMTALVLGVDPELVTPDTRLWRSMEIVSLAKLVGLCEARFRVAIDDERVASLRTVRDLARLIAQLQEDGTDDYAQPDDAARNAWYYE